MDTFIRVFAAYASALSRLSVDIDQIRCRDSLEYKLYQIKINLAMNMQATNEPAMGVSLRRAMWYEIAYGLHDRDEDRYAHLLRLGSKPSRKAPLTLRELDCKTDATLILNFAFSLSFGASQGVLPADESTSKARLNICAGCNTTEGCLGEHKTCSRCKQVFYCNAQCQLAHWPTHKKPCKKTVAAAVKPTR